MLYIHAHFTEGHCTFAYICILIGNLFKDYENNIDRTKKKCWHNNFIASDATPLLHYN